MIDQQVLQEIRHMNDEAFCKQFSQVKEGYRASFTFRYPTDVAYEKIAQQIKGRGGILFAVAGGIDQVFTFIDSMRPDLTVMYDNNERQLDILRLKSLLAQHLPSRFDYLQHLLQIRLPECSDEGIRQIMAVQDSCEFQSFDVDYDTFLHPYISDAWLRATIKSAWQDFHPIHSAGKNYACTKNYLNALFRRGSSPTERGSWLCSDASFDYVSTYLRGANTKYYGGNIFNGGMGVLGDIARRLGSGRYTLYLSNIESFDASHQLPAALRRFPFREDTILLRSVKDEKEKVISLNNYLNR